MTNRLWYEPLLERSPFHLANKSCPEFMQTNNASCVRVVVANQVLRSGNVGNQDLKVQF